jgi:putative serine protease PepD
MGTMGSSKAAKGSQKTMPRNTILAVATAAVLAGGGAGAAVYALTAGGSTKTVVDRITQTAPPVASVSNSSSSDMSVGDIYKANEQGIVEVDVTLSSSSSDTSPFPGGGSGGTQAESAEGTGWVYDTLGHIVTNEHVIAGATSVKVSFGDGKTYDATIVGSDPSTDVAVLKVNAPASELSPLTIGDSSTVAVGDGVVAIGDPFGLDDSVTSGIVSAVNREIQAPDNTPIDGAIQTDAAINHGNSGGPLFNLQGQVIGVTAQIESDSDSSDGVGFAVPSNLFKTIADELIATGKATHPLLGVDPGTATNGVKIVSVASGSGAAKAGLKAGDVITAFDGKAVTSVGTLRAVIAAKKPGDSVTVTYRRSGSNHTVKVTLGTRPSS